MARKRMIDPNFWVDEKLSRVSREARITFMGCISQADDEGRLQGHPALLKSLLFPYDTDIDHEDVSNWLQELADQKLIVMYEVDSQSYVFLPNFSKHQTINKKTESKLPPPPVQEDYGSGTVVVNDQSSRSVSQKKRKEEKRKEKKYSRKPKVYDEDSVYFQLAKLLFDKILENNPEHKQPNLQKWADDVRLMMERDNRTEEQIRYLIEWAQNDSFWKRNILSIAKLREKFDQLTLIVKEEKAKKIRPFPKKSELDQLPSYYQPIDVNHWRNEG